MGLSVGQIQTTLERKYSEVRIVRNLHNNTVQLYIVYVDGFYAPDGSWRTVDSGTMVVEGDAVYAIMHLTSSKLGLDTNAFDHALNEMVYGVLSGQIPLKAVLSVRVVNQEGKPVPATVSVEKGDVKYALKHGAEVVFDLPVLVGAKVVAVAEGYQPISEDVPVLHGEVSLTLTLTPEAPSQ